MRYLLNLCSSLGKPTQICNWWEGPWFRRTFSVVQYNTYDTTVVCVLLTWGMGGVGTCLPLVWWTLINTLEVGVKHLLNMTEWPFLCFQFTDGRWGFHLFIVIQNYFFQPLQEKLDSVAPVAYVDLEDGEAGGFVRFKFQQAAEKVLSQDIAGLDTISFTLLTGKNVVKRRNNVSQRKLVKNLRKRCYFTVSVVCFFTIK